MSPHYIAALRWGSWEKPESTNRGVARGWYDKLLRRDIFAQFNGRSFGSGMVSYKNKDEHLKRMDIEGVRL